LRGGDHQACQGGLQIAQQKHHQVHNLFFFSSETRYDLQPFLSRVDQPDVDLDEDDAPAFEEEAEDEAMETNEQQEPNKKQFKLSYEKYKKISFLIIEHIRFFTSIFGKRVLTQTSQEEGS
jgi:hypothetical protein